MESTHSNQVRTEDKRARVALITGATGAIGKAIAQGIAKDPGYEVVLVARDEGKAHQAVRDITQATGNGQVRYELADVSRRGSIQAMTERWHGPLHVLVNNAALASRGRQETPEGIELQFATNVLGYVWMIEAFAEHLKRSSPARVVNVASYWAGDLDLDDLEFKRRRYDNGKAYRQSKQANRMLTVAIAERLEPYGVVVNACHPGDVSSKVSNSLGFGGHETPEQGARTPVWLATNAIGGEVTGKYFEHMREVRCRFGEDRQAVERLYEVCQGYD
jgi:NAD(P)-dependent dehydrogenase (short-subunit alcohol dehydrogenase family)